MRAIITNAAAANLSTTVASTVDNAVLVRVVNKTSTAGTFTKTTAATPVTTISSDIAGNETVYLFKEPSDTLTGSATTITAQSVNFMY